MSPDDQAYARDNANQIQADINRQTGVNEAIAQDEERLRVIEAELNKIKPRLESNRKHAAQLKSHLPYRVMSHELLCEKMGWKKPEFQWPRPGHRPVTDNTWDKLTSHVEVGRSPIGDQVEQDVLASRSPVSRETEEYLMRPNPKDNT